MVCNFRISPSQLCLARRVLYIEGKKIGVLVENFPLGGAKRFDNRYVLTFFLSCKISVCRKLCHFVEHIGPDKISKNCEWEIILYNSKKWVSNIGFCARISRTMHNFRIPPSDLCRARLCPYTGCKKFGASLENLPLGGVNRFYRGSVWIPLISYF